MCTLHPPPCTLRPTQYILHSVPYTRHPHLPNPPPQVLLDNGADVNAAGDEGNTALMSASESLNAAAVELLMDRGADENKKNNGAP